MEEFILSLGNTLVSWYAFNLRPLAYAWNYTEYLLCQVNVLDGLFVRWVINQLRVLLVDNLLCKQEYLVPEEYVQTMRESMLNKCPVSSYDQVCEVFKKELGETPDKVCIITLIYFRMETWNSMPWIKAPYMQIFEEFDPVPIASASLAQVHVARTLDGQKVAVKVSIVAPLIENKFCIFLVELSFQVNV